MILEMDIGNTRIKWRLLNAASDRLAGGVSEHSIDFLQLIYADHQELSRVRLACVAKRKIVSEIVEAVEQLWSVKALSARTQDKLGGLEVVYSDVSRLGVDRWLAMLAAYHMVKQSVCVIDCGTAITVDLVDCSGKQVGGYIVPGIAMQVSSLLKSTGQIRLEQSIETGLQGWGCSTEEAVNFGVSRQVSSFINSIVDEQIETEQPPVFFITGGDACEILPIIHCADQFRWCPELVMEGLGIALPG